MIDVPPPSYEQTVEALVRCDVPRANITIAYSKGLQSDEVTISDLGSVDEHKMRCVKSAVHPFYIITLAREEQRARYYEVDRRDSRPAEAARARRWLADKGLSNELPTYDPARGLPTFAKALEAVCGIQPGLALDASVADSLTLRPEFIGRPDFISRSGQFECLINAYSASNAPDSGISFGLIGNAAVEKPEK